MTETKGEVSVMASFLDNLRRMVGMKPRNDEEPKKKQEQPELPKNPPYDPDLKKVMDVEVLDI